MAAFKAQLAEAARHRKDPSACEVNRLGHAHVPGKSQSTFAVGQRSRAEAQS